MTKELLKALFVTFFSAVAVSGVYAQGNENSPNNEIRNFNVGIPVELTSSTNQFEMSASLLILQPGTSNLRYATLITPLPFLTPQWEDQAVSPAFRPAFNVDLRYNFDSGGDLRLDWTHLNTTDHESAVAGTNQALGPNYLIGPPPPYISASTALHFTYDAVNLNAGLPLSIGNHVQLRPFFGLEGARINQLSTTNFLNANGDISFTDTSKSTFTGVGPRLGLDMHYGCGRFDFLGGMAGAALIGQRQSQVDFVTSSPRATANGLSPNYQYITSPDSTQVIPSIDGKLGGSYSMALGGFLLLKCEVGYQTAVYINALNPYALTEVENNIVAPNEGNVAVFLRTTRELQSDFFVHGPYFKVAFEY